MDNKYTDVDFQEIDNNVYYTAVQVSEIIGETVHTVRTWCKDSNLGEVLNIKKVNGRNVFTKVDIENLKFVKELRAKNYSISQTREYISKQGFKYGEFDGGLIDTKDPLGFTALAIKISEENEKKMIEFENRNRLMLEEFKKTIVSELGSVIKESYDTNSKILSEVCVAIDETIPNVLETHSKALQEDLKVQSENILQNQIKGITGHFEGIIKQQNNDIVERDIKITNQLHEVLALRKKEIMEKELEQQESKGFFKRLFGK